MKTLLERELNTYNIKKDTPIAMALSGGVDSITLYNQLLDLGYNILGLHFNHGLREESNIEENHLLATYENIISLKWDNPSSSEEACRKARYNFFKEECYKHGINHIFFGHHANDNAENFLMRLIKGTSYSGAKSMVSKSNNTLLGEHITVYRPLLSIKKKEIYRVATENNYVWFEDDTNKENNYMRNRIRNVVIPLLVKENKTAVEQINSFTEEMEDVASIIDEKVNEVYSKVASVNDYAYMEEYNLLSYDFLEENELIQREVLKLFLKDTLDKEYIISKSEFKVILNVIKNLKPNQQYSFKNGTYLFADILHGKKYLMILTADDLSDKAPLRPKLEQRLRYVNSLYDKKNEYSKLLKAESTSIKKGNIRLTEYYNKYQIPYFIRRKKVYTLIPSDKYDSGEFLLLF